MSNRDALQRYHENRAKMLAGGGEKRIEAQHDKGKLTARERLDLLLDKGSFVEQQPYITVRATDFGLADKKFLDPSPIITHDGVFWDGEAWCLSGS